MKRFVPVAALAALCAFGTTLRQLSLTDLALKSTTIVRAKVLQSTAATRGSIVYTHYLVQPTEQWKGSSAGPIDVAVPGGTVNGLRQVYSGAPALTAGQDYVFFLWRSPSGLNQVIGLSQGLFVVSTSSAGIQIVSRAAASSPMVNGAGQDVNDLGFSMALTDFRTQVGNILKGSAR